MAARFAVGGGCCNLGGGWVLVSCLGVLSNFAVRFGFCGARYAFLVVLVVWFVLVGGLGWFCA